MMRSLGYTGRTSASVGRPFLSAVVLVFGIILVRLAVADEIPPGWQTSNMELVGFSGLGGHSAAFKLSIKQANGRWYLYMGHSFEPGWSILDVTDPKDPKYVKFIPGPQGTITSQITLHDNLMLTGLGPDEGGASGGSATKAAEAAVLLWDISDPANPKQISGWKGGPRGTHRNSYPGGKYAYLSANMPGYRGRILVILDVSDPKNPKEAGRWWMHGQKEGETAIGKVSPGFHGPANISPDGKIAAMGYAPAIINLDISDIEHPKLIGQLTMTPPFPEVGAQSEHTVLPLWDRKILFASSEASASGCDTEPVHYAALIDNKDPSKPRLISLFPVPRPPKDAPYKDFCDKGGRFGPHNVSQETHSPDVQKPGNMIHITYFNAGLRAFNISDPHLPTETGWFIPPERPDAPKHSGPHESPINWTEDVLVDARGYIYITDDKWGVWILKDSAPAQGAPSSR